MQQNNHNGIEVAAKQKPQLLFLIIGAVAVSLCLVVLSMWLYNMSGAAQLDLSRPGYQDVRAQAQTSTQFKGFESTGSLDKKALDSFDKLYRQQKKEISDSSDGFSAAPLSNEALEIRVE